MPHSQTKLPELATRLRDYLHEVLPNAHLSTAETSSTLQPLLLLQSAHNVAAFALPNDNVRGDFDVLYSRFKDLCNQRSDWEELDANFVFCVPQPMEDLEAFCSEIETDVYFCRKFVVPIDRGIPQALARLPFLPLEDLKSGGLRPDSAQVFLQRHGVPAVLGGYLVLPQKRGPEEIVKDCLEGHFGSPVLSAVMPAIGGLSIDHTLQAMRLRRVEIENFRAYQKPQVFEIASDITVLYGPNGFGKTSFFDAIEFAVTGGIGRLQALTETEFRKAAKHFESEPSKSTVTIVAAAGATELKIKRSVAKAKQATVNGTQRDRKAVLASLTGATTPSAERIDHLIRLFRATHQFDQEAQELARTFQEDCRLEADILSRMLAFEDYNHAVTKARRVHEHLVDEIAKRDVIVSDAETLAAQFREENRRLSESSQKVGGIATLEEGISKLREDLISAGIAAEEDHIDTSVIRGWRAAVSSLQSKHANNARRLTEVSSNLGGLADHRQSVETRTQALVEKEQEHTAAELLQAEAALSHQRANQTLSRAKDRLEQLTARKTLLGWIRNTKPRYSAALAQERSLADELEKIGFEVAGHRTKEEELEVKLRTEEGELASCTENAASLEKVRTLLNSFLVASQQNFDLLGKLRELQREKQSLSQELVDLEPLLRKTLEDQISFVTEGARLDAQIKRSEAQQSEFNRLISDLVRHIDSGTCPVCAANYGSKEDLLRRVQGQANAEITTAEHQRRQELRDILAVARDSAESLSSKAESAKQRLAVIAAEEAQIEESLSTFQEYARSSLLRANLPTESNSDVVQAGIANISQEIADNTELAAEKQRLVVDLRESLTEIRNSASQVRFIREGKEKTLMAVRGELDRMRADPQFGQSSLDVPDEQLTEEEALTLDQISETEGAISKATAEVTEKKLALDEARRSGVTLRSELQRLRSQIATGKKWIDDFDIRLAAENLTPTITPDELTTLIQQESKREVSLSLLSEAASTIELALDVATTAAALSRLNEQIQAEEKRKSDAERARQKLSPWRDYFDKLRLLLTGQQDLAVANFTNLYGPRASVIQRRLRTVYGFDEITLSPAGSDILVRATRRGEALRPIDYFSQSQQQSLLLALFLTACSSQTWSNFCPVLLDDPVTHFDDLNTYAFLDLLVGLLDAQKGPRQFILSTCDDRLFQLARQKFRHLGAGAAFYAFRSSGEGGPQIEQLSAP